MLLTVRLPGVEVAIYEVIGLPPVAEGARKKATVACAFPAVAVTLVGASGTVGAGVTLLEAADGVPIPTAFVAFTVKV